ncbi:MAG: DUF3326 domain-containing protein [Candidatus Rifleibacteriota bacterium]
MAIQIYEKEFHIPPSTPDSSLLVHIRKCVENKLSADEIPVRFTVIESGPSGYSCELGLVVADEKELPKRPRSIFEVRPRAWESGDSFCAAMIIPTGVDCEVGGDAGDAGPAARLLASCCDRLILHPNVVNASDINELPENSLYVEGSVLSKIMMGTAGVLPVRSNRILLIIDDHKDKNITDSYINTFSAARATWGMRGAGVVALNPTFYSRLEIAPSGRASGRIEEFGYVLQALEKHRGEYDAVAIASVMDSEEGKGLIKKYYETEMLNPWGGLEAMLTHTTSLFLDLPSAHSPMVEDTSVYDLGVGVVDERKAAELVSTTYLHCILKGLHRSPRIITDPEVMKSPEVVKAENVACLVQPAGCLGLPTLAALEQGIPVIAVRGNTNIMKNDLRTLSFRSDKYFEVENYLEAAGLMSALRAGVDPATVYRPISKTIVDRKA